MFLGEVKERKKGKTDDWTISLQVGQHPIRFKVDSGADVNVLSLQQFSQLHPRPALLPAQYQISSVGGTLDVVGVCREQVKHKQVSL